LITYLFEPSAIRYALQVRCFCDKINFNKTDVLTIPKIVSTFMMTLWKATLIFNLQLKSGKTNTVIAFTSLARHNNLAYLIA